MSERFLAAPPKAAQEKVDPALMLQDFIVANREVIIARVRTRVRERTAAKPADSKLEHSVPLFLAQLTDALGPAASLATLQLVGASDARKSITDGATLSGHDLLRNGFTLAQVLRGYGEVSEVVRELASETNATISAGDFRLFERCLDDAIAGAVTAYGHQRERELPDQGTERLGVVTHELRSMLSSAILSFDVIKKGLVGLGGSTSAIHARALSGVSALVERTLAEARLAAGTPRLERVLLCELMEELEVSAKLEAEAHGVHLSLSPVAADIVVDADRQLLAFALTNLLQNAVKSSRGEGTVSLATRVTKDRVAIDVSDTRAGAPAGKLEDLAVPFTRGASGRSGSGPGPSIALAAARANSGLLSVRNVPGTGCVFTLDLPRQPSAAASLFHVLPDGAHGSFQGTDPAVQGRPHPQDPKSHAS